MLRDVHGRPWGMREGEGLSDAHICSEVWSNKWSEWPGQESRSLICGYPSARMNLLVFSDASVNNKFRRTLLSKGTLLGR